MIRSTVQTTASDGVEINPHPQEPSFVADFLHGGLYVWVAMIVVGVLLVPTLVGVRRGGLVQTGDPRVATGYIAAMVLILAGGLLVILSV